MKEHRSAELGHEHVFGMDEVRKGERRTFAVAVLTAVFMVVEIVGGIAFGSMALLADGMHMGSHAVALGISVAAYVYARRRAHDPRFSFGVGKVNALAGFTGALLLAVFAIAMAHESVDRILNPATIVFDAAIIVACLGLAVNLASVLMLGGVGHGHEHHHHQRDLGENHGHDEGSEHEHHHDYNLKSAYLHVLADALTSVAAIVALVAGKYWGLVWLDPVMGIAGSLLVARWSWGLLRETSRVLLDHQIDARTLDEIRAALEEAECDRVVDLHVWEIGPGVRAAAISIVCGKGHPPAHFKEKLPSGHGLRHVTIEVHPQNDGPVAARLAS